MIYKLAKTTPLLSGQVRWDMCLSYGDDRPVIDSLHIVPINDNIVYNEDNSRKTYNYPHTENLKRLFKTLGGNFFSTIGKYQSTHAIYNNGILQDPFDHTYRSGARRMNRYSRYNRQFSYMCPMWISEDIDYSKLKFIITVQDGDKTNTRMNNYMTTLSLSDDFIRYISEYMGSSSNNQPVGDELVNFKFDPISAYISGVQVSTGHYQVTDVTNILHQLIDRERPLMEFDSMILHEFEQHKMIAQQLINFNLVFNINDICPQSTAHTIQNHAFNVKVDVMYDGKVVPTKDFYTNYTNIPSYNINIQQYDKTKNVLDYLHDNMYKDFAYINKMQQCIFHWALLENPDVLYNMYDGFGPIIVNQDGSFDRLCGMYANQSNIQARDYSIFQNNLEWCKYIYASNADLPIEIDALVDKPGMCSDFNLPVTSDGICWFNNNKYILNDVAPSTDIIDGEPQNVKCILVIAPSDAKAQMFAGSSTSHIAFTQLSSTLYIKRVVGITGVMYAFISSNKNLLTLGSIHDLIAGQSSLPNQFVSVLTNIKNMFRGWVAPYKIEFRKSILSDKVYFDKGYSDMIEYYKINSSFYSYVYRYTGKLTPCFIDLDGKDINNLEFYYKQWKDISDTYPQQDITISEYNRLLKAGYEPEFYKLDDNFEVVADSFYSFNSIKQESNQPDWYTNDNPDYGGPWRGEVCWLNDNKLWNIPTTFETQIVVDSNVPNEVIMKNAWDTLYQKFGSMGLHISSQLYDTGVSEEWCRNWIYSKYKIDIVTEYGNDGQDIKHIVCKIKFKLQ